MWTEVSRFRQRGDEFILFVMSGNLLETSERSDTHVHGSGSTSGVGGHVTGTVSISSDVIVTRNAYLKMDNGRERVFQFKEDIPMRAGNRITVFGVKSQRMKHPETDGVAIYAVYNHQTDEWRSINHLDLVKGEPLDGSLFWFGFLAIFAYGLGLLFLAALILPYRKARRQANAIESEVRRALPQIRAAQQVTGYADLP